MVTLKKGLPIQADLAKSLEKHPATLAIFLRMRPSCQREYSEWVASGKALETRERRISSVLERVNAWGEKNPIKNNGKKK
jgi:uncharacterized protein YdeI (YjbR/CyaY-like superfamily)